MSTDVTQKQVIGERLFPLVVKMTAPEIAGKITGMLLEMDNTELLHMLDHTSGDILKAKVGEAVAVLKSHGVAEATNISTTEEMQKQMIGERLYPLVQRINPNLAAKITGMMLEMDNAELLQILESEDDLNAKVNEAVAVLQSL